MGRGQESLGGTVRETKTLSSQLSSTLCVTHSQATLSLSFFAGIIIPTFYGCCEDVNKVSAHRLCSVKVVFYYIIATSSHIQIPQRVTSSLLSYSILFILFLLIIMAEFIQAGTKSFYPSFSILLWTLQFTFLLPNCPVPCYIKADVANQKNI